MARPPLSPVPLDRLRALRNRRERDLSLASGIDRLAKEMTPRHRGGGAAAAAWESVAPAELKELAVPTGLARGVLTLKAPDASARFALDRWLRSGGESEIIRAARVGVKRVKVVP